jgi:hypothetical protein
MKLTIKLLREFCDMADIEKKRTKSELIQTIKKYLGKYKFAPRYLRGLTPDEQFLKKFEIRYYQLLERNKGIKSYVYTPLDKDKKSKKISTYTQRWNNKYPDATTLSEKSHISGVPVGILKKVYNKGMAAWRGSSHRPGATQQQWGVSRVNSFLLCGKTWRFPDHLLAKEALKSPKTVRFWDKCPIRKLGVKTSSR